jgi:hypothetical protein
MKMKKICIVGYGSHVKNTIIPSLNLKNKNIKIVTKKIIDDFETISNLRLALKKLPKDYIFFNSTPPKFHYSISKLILSSGFNIIVEKPLCLNTNQLKKLNDIAKKKRLFIFENMMYLYSSQFNIFKKLLNKKKTKEIEINFSIPDFSKKSFRNGNKLESSLLYDMGCYPFSLLSYFGFNSKNYKVFYKSKNKKINLIKILFNSKNIKFKITVAIFKAYENYVKVRFTDNSYYQMNHFFYGKKKNKINYFYELNKKVKIIKINEENIFKSIFNYSNQKLLKLSRIQFFVIKDYLFSLNQIKKHIKL